jgi:hypothetical protein
MMVRTFQCAKKAFLLILFAGLASSCVTYRDIQKDFNSSVQADSTRTVEGTGSLTSSSLVGYEQVLDKLDDTYLQSLDPKLKMNAYAMKAVAQWRTGRLAEAKQSANTALALKNLPPSPRDQMVLLIIPPLVNDQNLHSRYRQLPEPKRVNWMDYKNIYEKDFADAAAELKSAAAQASPDLPVDMLIYVEYQRWRVLRNWGIVLNELSDGDKKESLDSIKIRNQARVHAKGLLNGVELSDEAKTQKEKIPEGHWLRPYIEYKEKQ